MESRDRFNEESLDEKIGTVLMKNPWMEFRDPFGEESLDGK